MDFNPQHDQALDLPLRFPDDPVEAASLPVPSPASRPSYTLFIRVPAPRNGFVDPPDIDWNKEKDDALWQVLSRASKNDIDWNELSENFAAPIDFLLIQATILTERHVSQLRAQTRKVATLNSGAGAGDGIGPGGRDSPMQSPALGGPSGCVSASRLMATPTPSSAAMRRVTSTGSRSGQNKQGVATPSGGISGTELTSRRSSSEENIQRLPVRPSRPSLESITHPTHEAQSPTSQGYPAYAPATAQHRQARLQSPLSLHAAQATDTRDERDLRRTYEGEGDGMRGHIPDAAEPTSPAALSDSSSSSSSTPSEPVMSRIFKRPPGHVLPSQRQTQRQQRGGDHGYRTVGLGISPGASDDDKNGNDDDDDDESEPQAAFLRIKTPINVAKSTASAGGGSGSGRGSQHRHHQQSTRLQHRRSNTGDSSSASSSTSASPTAKVFKTQTVAAATAAAAGGNPGSATSASAMAAARLQSSRGPGIRSPPHLQNYPSGRSPAVLAVKAASISREGSETGTTPSIGSSFSDLDNVSFTQSVLDEALGSKVEDTLVSHNPNSFDPMSSSAMRRQR
ncbi:hypothetical protein SEPCBS57363_006066 [Sporothrix epigloea]|uniref:Autophagy-related protein 29 n=1 Tax=Sporothrix epigloea TaxID=1892477 RepID=A0ABP0E114_9PEZI